jgi:hypothetical protein
MFDFWAVCQQHCCKHVQQIDMLQAVLICNRSDSTTHMAPVAEVSAHHCEVSLTDSGAAPDQTLHVIHHSRCTDRLQQLCHVFRRVMLPASSVLGATLTASALQSKHYNQH